MINITIQTRWKLGKFFLLIAGLLAFFGILNSHYEHRRAEVNAKVSAASIQSAAKTLCSLAIRGKNTVLHSISWNGGNDYTVHCVGYNTMGKEGVIYRQYDNEEDRDIDFHE